MVSKLVSHNNKVYVGDIPNRFLWSGDAIPDCFTPPKNFFSLANSQGCNVYCNNMDIVRYYKPENVIVVYIDDFLEWESPLSNHPDFEKWSQEMDSGEMFSLFGNRWVAPKD